MSERPFPAIPEPGGSSESQITTLRALREAVQLLTGQTARRQNTATIAGVPINSTTSIISVTELSSYARNLSSSVTIVSGNIDAERVARIAADDVLQDNIDAEGVARAAADDVLQDNIDAEGVARAAADSTLTTAVTAAQARADSITGTGKMKFVEDVTALDAGVDYAWDLQYSRTGSGGSFVETGLRVEAMSDLTVRIVIAANAVLKYTP